MSNERIFTNVIVIGNFTSDPSVVRTGALYYNTSTNKFRVYDGSSWQDLSTGASGANTALSNLITTSINQDLVPNADATKYLGSGANRWGRLYAVSWLDSDDSSFFVMQGTQREAYASDTNLSIDFENRTLKYAGSSKLGWANASYIDAFSNKLSNVTDPAAPQDAATKFYVDNLVAGVTWKNAVRAASTANLNLASMPAAVDGVTLVSGNRFLAKNQTTGADNGIYIFNGAGSAATRSTDMDAWSEVVGSVMLVEEGTVNAGSKWVNTNIDGGTLGTTAITFVAFSVAGTVSGTGTSGYVAYWNGSASLTAEQYLSTVRGGTGGDSSAATGIAHVSSGTWSYSLIVNADVSASAAIAYSKLNLSASIVNADIAAAAAIAYNKLAALTASRVLVSDGSGFVSASTVTTTTLGFLDATSSIQTQFGGKANTALSNLSSTAVNVDIAPNVDNTIRLGGGAKNYTETHTKLVKSSTDLSLNANDGANKIDEIASKHRISTDGTNFMEEQYFDSLTLTANISSPTEVSASLSFASASFSGGFFTYVIKEATSNRVRKGTFEVANDGTTPSLADNFTESGGIVGAGQGIVFTADISGGNVRILYNTTHATNNATMRVKRTLFR